MFKIESVWQRGKAKDTGVIPLIKNPKSKSSWVPLSVIHIEKVRLRDMTNFPKFTLPRRAHLGLKVRVF